MNKFKLLTLSLMSASALMADVTIPAMAADDAEGDPKKAAAVGVADGAADADALRAGAAALDRKVSGEALAAALGPKKSGEALGDAVVDGGAAVDAGKAPKAGSGRDLRAADAAPAAALGPKKSEEALDVGAHAAALPAMSYDEKIRAIDEAIEAASAPALKRSDSAARLAKDGKSYADFASEQAAREAGVTRLKGRLEGLKFAEGELDVEKIAIASLTAKGQAFEGQALELIYTEKGGNRILNSFKVDGKDVTKAKERSNGLAHIRAALDAARGTVSGMTRANAKIERALGGLSFTKTAGVTDEDSYRALRFDGAEVTRRIRALVGRDVEANPTNDIHRHILSLTGDQFGAILSLVQPEFDDITRQWQERLRETETALRRTEAEFQEANELANSLVDVQSELEALKDARRPAAALTRTDSGAIEVDGIKFYERIPVSGPHPTSGTPLGDDDDQGLPGLISSPRAAGETPRPETAPQAPQVSRPGTSSSSSSSSSAASATQAESDAAEEQRRRAAQQRAIEERREEARLQAERAEAQRKARLAEEARLQAERDKARREEEQRQREAESVTTQTTTVDSYSLPDGAFEENGTVFADRTYDKVLGYISDGRFFPS